ncbi:pilus assembly protein [Roseibium denhamense]|uniref:Flp pilus assembly protein TadG n=1 Tax=Roseibium denhamense TaxID=76305 RepID=A0ABY1PB33_9HYPH|nr:TadE/TadG family type IV pilus assembly protein [Roseibium denhamense]MTI05291.1 pilus assembly protein [Roseibium denhamense]SMP30545.1 Flp pilus assembly protein TadG [Roseibium denhamense]
MANSRVTLRNLINRFGKDARGAVLPAFAICVAFIFLLMGFAVDLSRSITAREKLAYAIDAAALSVASELSVSVMSDAQIRTALENSLRANLAGEDFLDEAIAHLTFTVDSDNGTISVDSNASLNEPFVDISKLGYDAVDGFSFGSDAEVTYSRFDVELALIVDVTGSMSGDMVTLREASTDVVNILLPEDQDPSTAKVRISLIPYSAGVNLGTYADDVKGGAHGYGDSSDCVTEREDYDDGSEVWEVKYTDLSYAYYNETNPPPMETFYGNGGSCASDSVLIPLTNDRDLLIPAIADLEASGTTSGHTGAIWGWNSLSPNYKNLWPSDSEPASYDDENVLKFAIMMTDGDNNRTFELIKTETEEECGWKQNKKGKWKYRCKDVVSDLDPSNYYWDDVSSGSGYDDDPSSRHREYCDAMKDAGIQIFGVYFGSNNSSTGGLNMQYCASDGSYYQASSSEGLKQAFSNIAKKIQQIYLSQ